MISSDYPMTFGYGRTDSPYGTAQYPYHRGDDYAMPEGTPIVVNGVQIGICGSTGYVTGPHCHIGRFINGKDTNPNSEGWQLTAPLVTNITYDEVNGNEVGLVDTAGVRWVYLHMRDLSTFVKVGDYLDQLPKYKKEDDMVPTRDLLNALFWNFRGRQATDQEAEQFIGKISYNELIPALNTGDEHDKKENSLRVGSTATKDNWEGQIWGLIDRINKLQSDLSADDAAKMASEVQAVINKYKK